MGDSRLLSVTVLFGHLGGMLLAGGAALAADRRIIGAARRPERRQDILLDLPGCHRTAIRGLTLLALTGVLLTLGDLETFVASRAFYAKLTVVALLLLNGVLLTRAERLARGAASEAAWARLRWAALSSTVLWFAAALAGVWLTKAA